MIHFFCEKVNFVLSQKAKRKNWIKFVTSSENKVIGNVNFIFTSDEHILEINKQYLNHDYFTDIITFDYCENDKLIGDIFISLDTIAQNATEYQCSFDEELSRVIVHGVLHLIGYKDHDESQKLVMRNKENIYLKEYYSNFLIN